jgi:hypothetical protein
MVYKSRRPLQACRCSPRIGLAKIEQEIGDRKITAWNITIAATGAAAIDRAISTYGVALDALLRDSTRRERRLHAVPLLLVRDGKEVLLPPGELPLKRGISCSSPARTNRGSSGLPRW